MRISKFGWVGAAAVLGSCVAAGAVAQDAAGQPPAGGGQRRPGGGFGQGRFGRGGGQISILNVPVDILVKELKLTEDQKTAIVAAQTKYRTDAQALSQPPADGSQPDRQALGAKFQELGQKATKDIDAILKDDQKADATALTKNLQSLQMLSIPWQSYSDLKLTTEQKTKLTALAADTAKARAAKQQELQQEIQAARQSGDQAKMQELFTQMRGTGKPDEKTLEVLTAEQKDAITKYAKDHPQQPGRRPGGFGPGAAPQP